MSPLLAALAAVMLLAAARELLAEHGERAGEQLRRLADRAPGPRLGAWASWPGTAGRLRRAGLADRFDPRVVLGTRICCFVAGIPIAVTVSPVLPARLIPAALVALPLAAAAAPDVYLDRLARRRREEIARTMPDALELMAVGAASGRGAGALLAEAARADGGVLGEELAMVVAELESGSSQAEAIQRLGEEVGGELAAVAVLLERSRRLGSPLAAGLQERAADLRSQRARLTREHAAKAAPKIQLIVALLLVPSVLLIVAAAIIANADALLVGL
jgi:tight adherence protein C